MMDRAPPADTRVLVFARAPEPGAAKTRLIPLLGAPRAAALQYVLTDRALATARAAKVGPVELWCAPSAQHPLLARLAAQHGVETVDQCDGDLGARMLDAAASTLAIAPRVIIMGADCPALTTRDLQDAAAELAGNHDVALLPAEDGGYALIGLKRWDARLFADIAWGTEQVMGSTRAALAALGWRWTELGLTWDIDRPADFERLVASGLIPDLEDAIEHALAGPLPHAPTRPPNP